MSGKSKISELFNQRESSIQEQNSHEKSYEELNLMDSFLFEAATEKPENAVIIAKVIIERATGRKVKKLVVETQKDLKGINVNKHGIRMDVYTTEIDATESGDNRMVYTVKNLVTENNQIVYNDGVTKIFLYTKGMVGGSKKLKELLTFMEESTRDNAVDDELLKLMNIVDGIKSDPEERRRYMGIMGVIDYEKRDAYNMGHSTGFQEGIEEGIQNTIQVCKILKNNKDETKKAIMEQFSLTEDRVEEYMTHYWNEA